MPLRIEQAELRKYPKEEGYEEQPKVRGDHGMYDRVGQKIKGVANFICGLGMLASVLFGMSLWQSSMLRARLIIIGGCLASWLGSLGLYGFGELIDCTAANCELNARILDILESKFGYEEEPAPRQEPGRQSNQKPLN